MATGRPSKSADARFQQPISLGKSGMSIVIWDKWGRKRRGTMVVSVGGARWYPYKTRRPTKLTCDRFAEVIEDKGRLV